MYKKSVTDLSSREEYICYIIEYYSEKFKNWYPLGDMCFSLRDYEHGEFTSCGSCWQKTGIHGTFNIEYAKEFCNKLNEELKNGTLISNSDLNYSVKSRYSDCDIKGFHIRKLHYINESEIIEADKY